MTASKDNTTSTTLVEKYLNFFNKSERNPIELETLLNANMSFQSPLGRFESADSFLDDVKNDKLQISSIEIREILTDGSKACARYDVTSKDPEIGTLNFTDWFEIEDEKIQSIVSICDASGVKAVYSSI